MLLLREIIFAAKMKKLVAIFFISLLASHFVPAFSSFMQQSVVCLDLEEEKNTDKSKDRIKEKLEKKEFETNRQSGFTSITQHFFHCDEVNFPLQQPDSEIPTPPPNC